MQKKGDQYNSSDWNDKSFSEMPALSWPCCKDKWGLVRNCDEVSELAYSLGRASKALFIMFCKGFKLQGATLRVENKCCKWLMYIKRDQHAAVSQRALAKSGQSIDDAAKYETAWGNYAVENEMLKEAASRCQFLLYLQLCTGSWLVWLNSARQQGASMPGENRWCKGCAP